MSVSIVKPYFASKSLNKAADMRDMLPQDDLWDDMPVVRAEDPKKIELDDEDQKKFHYRAPQAKLDEAGPTLRDKDDIKKGKKGKEKSAMEYTRLELDEDVEGDNVHLRTDFLFDDNQEMTPLSQMQATKDLLTEGQRIAYVGLCKLISRELVQGYRNGRVKELEPAAESAQNWANKIMGRLYLHMDVSQSEQRMFDQLAEHGVLATDLVPSLITTHTIANPQFSQEDANAADSDATTSVAHEDEGDLALDVDAEPNPFDQPPALDFKDRKGKSTMFEAPQADDGDLAWATATPGTAPSSSAAQTGDAEPSESADEESSQQQPRASTSLEQPLPHTLPGVSETVSTTDATVTLDIRWTILCDLFLALIADSVYDSRSRVLLARSALALGLDWHDVLRFERRLTEALQLQEGVDEEEQDEIMDDRAKKGRKRRLAMMAAAGLGGGLVIGLSAGLLAPVIGAGVGATLGMVGVSGTGFLAGTGGAAVVTTTGVLAGSGLATRSMGRRTADVRTFEFLPLHNNKRVSCLITVPGFLKGRTDDVRLPFSVLDPILGDVFSVLWEPETILQTGSALKILTSEVLASAGQQILGATIMTGLMAGLTIPLWLSKLSYLIDNPWSNALDRSKSAGSVLADVLMKRHLGVRPISLAGFSLGARTIFYCLLELAKNKAFGIVQDVYLMGTTITANQRQWREVRGIVSGRLVNAYAQNDWILGYLYRASTGGLSAVAGLHPVEDIPDIENVDITDILDGHMSYRSRMPQILKHLGFRTSADHFDEPDEDDADLPDREVLTKEEELRRAVEKEKKKQKPSRWAWMRRKKDAGPDSPEPPSAPARATSYDSLDAEKAHMTAVIEKELSLSQPSTPAPPPDKDLPERDPTTFDTQRRESEIKAIQREGPAALETLENTATSEQIHAPEIVARSPSPPSPTQLAEYQQAPSSALAQPEDFDSGSEDGHFANLANPRSTDDSLPSWSRDSPQNPTTGSSDLPNPFAGESSLTFAGSNVEPGDKMLGPEPPLRSHESNPWA